MKNKIRTEPPICQYCGNKGHVASSCFQIQGQGQGRYDNRQGQNRGGGQNYQVNDRQDNRSGVMANNNTTDRRYNQQGMNVLQGQNDVTSSGQLVQ